MGNVKLQLSQRINAQAATIKVLEAKIEELGKVVNSNAHITNELFQAAKNMEQGFMNHEDGLKKMAMLVGALAQHTWPEQFKQAVDNAIAPDNTTEVSKEEPLIQVVSG